MTVIEEMATNQILWVAVLSWFVAQLLKVLFTLMNEHRLDLSKLFASGGMPSSHSSFVVALAFGVGKTQGYHSPLFAISAVLSCIVMYDAANVRLEAGKQAAMINQIIQVMEDPNLKPEQRLKEILGHTPLQVLGGAVLGFIIAMSFTG